MLLAASQVNAAITHLSYCCVRPIGLSSRYLHKISDTPKLAHRQFMQQGPPEGGRSRAMAHLLLP